MPPDIPETPHTRIMMTTQHPDTLHVKKDENESTSKRGEDDHDVVVGDLSEVRKKYLLAIP